MSILGTGLIVLPIALYLVFAFAIFVTAVAEWAINHEAGDRPNAIAAARYAVRAPLWPYFAARWAVTHVRLFLRDVAASLSEAQLAARQRREEQENQ